MANPNTLKEDIAILVEELGATEIASNSDFIVTLIDKWSTTIANYLNTVTIVPADALSNFNSGLNEDESPIESASPIDILALKSAISLGLTGIGLPVPFGFLPFFLNGVDAGHSFLVAQAATQGVVAIPPGPLGLQLRSITETSLSTILMLSTDPNNSDVRYLEIATAVDIYTKAGTWSLPNGVTGNWS